MKLLLPLLLLPILAFSQTTTIAGIVTDPRGEPLIGANVVLKDTYDGATTDADGKFNFTTEETGEKILQFSYLGYDPTEQPVTLDGKTMDLKIKLRESANQLDEVVISAGAFEASDEKKGVVLRPLDIVTTAGGNGDIAGAINTLPGTTTVGEAGQLFVRGGSGEETQTFIDGVQVQNFYTSNVPDVPARGRFSPFQFKGTIFASGGYSAEYGQALSGALILQTQDLPQQSSTSVGISVLSLNAGHTHVWKEKTSFGIEGSYFNLWPYLQVVPQNVEWNNAPSGAGGQVAFRHKTSETGVLKIAGNMNHSLVSIRYPGSEFYPSGSVRLENNFAFGNASYREQINDNLSVNAAVAYVWNRDDTGLDTFSVRTDNKVGEGRVTFNWDVARHAKIKFGADYQRRDNKESYNDPDGPSYTSKVGDNLTAAYAESEFYIGNKVVARAGLRSEYSTVLARANIAPRLSLAMKVGEGAQISGAYGMFYQTPDVRLLRVNGDLKYEQSAHYILNYQLIKGDRTFRVEGYYKTYNDLVKYDNAFDGNSFSNAGGGYARGVEVFWRDRKTIKNADYWVSYSFLDTKRNWRDYPIEARPTFASMHNFSLVYKHYIPKITSQISATYSFNTGRPYNDLNDPNGNFNAATTPFYQNFSLAGSYLTSIFGNFTVIFVSVTNVFGFHQVFSYRYAPEVGNDGLYARQEVGPQAPRFFFAGMFMSIAGKKFDRESLKREDKVD